MGLMDQIGSAIGGKSGGADTHNNSLMDSAIGLISGSGSGGLGGLLENFKSKGLGNEASSWVGTGANQPVSGEQIHHALGSEKIQQIANQAGVSPGEASSGLAGILPQIIDKLTPDGRVPSGGMLEQGIGLVKNTLMRH